MKAQVFFKSLMRPTLLVGSVLLVVPQAAIAQEPAAQGAGQQQGQTAGQEPADAGGYADPEGIPLRPPTPDIEPVYKGPAIDTLATIRKRGTLRVGVAWSEPMVMHDSEGELRGFSIDVGRQLAEDLGVEVEFVVTSWSQIIQDLLDRHFDVIASGLWVTPARALVVNFSEATSAEAVHLIAGKKLASQMKAVEDFNRPDVKIAVYAGTVQESVAKRHFPKATIITTEGDDDPLTPVLAGEAHGLLVATFAPKAFVQQAPDDLFLPLNEGLQSTISAMAIRKGDPDFLNYLNSWIAFHRDEGWLADRIRYWGETTDWMETQ